MVTTEDSESHEVDLQKLLKQQLHSLAQFGVAELPSGNGQYAIELEPDATEKVQPVQEQASKPAAAISLVKESKPAPQKVAAVPSPSGGTWGAAIDPALRGDALEVINAEVQGCQSCEELCSKRTQTVFGVGNPAAKLVFVGEGPGGDEDRLGEPFVGKAGKLLNKILAASQLKREEVYILNTVKCRPPRNRNPTDAEIANCWGYAERQLEVIQPEFICCLGSVAAKTMLQTSQSLGRLRGRFHPWRGARLIVTYHPAYLLRNEGAKRHVWEDMKMLVKEMGIELSK